jgi:beta-N-acetylhexosaminidase
MGPIRSLASIFAVTALLVAPAPTATGPPLPPLPPLSPRQLAGQRVIYSYKGLTPPRTLLAKIRAGEAAGVIFFADNVSGRAQLARVIARMQTAAAASPVRQPLLLMTDQEGGTVRRLPGAPVLSAKQIGASAHPLAAARQAGHDAAANLRRAGIDVNLAPVLDVYRSGGDFVDRYGRSFSDDPQAVARLGAAFVAAQQQAGVAATGKHFPGLGAAATFANTDERPVTLPVPLATLRAVDELPYRSAIAAGVRLVMVSWATYPALDPRRPAGLSRTVVQQELRRRLGFAGVTVTDALGAGALGAFGATGNRALLAAGAGMDLVLCAGRRVREGLAAVDALAAAIGSGRLGRAAFDASVRRVLALRSALAP